MWDSLLESWWFKTVLYGLLAAAGGSMGYIMRTLEKNEKVLWWRVFLEGGGAGFVGILVMFICQEMKLSQGYTGAMVGVAGWLGANATIRILERLFRKKIGVEQEPENASNPGSGR